VPHRHHDAIEFPDGSNVLVTLLTEGQRATVLQLPVVHQIGRKKHCAPTPSLYGLLMSASFHNADKRTHRRLMLVGLMFCGAFVVISFFAREQPENHYVLLKAVKLVRTAGTPLPAN
jgi:hypothetical protein